MINLPTGITLSEADFNKFMLVFGQIIDKAVDQRMKDYKPKSVNDVLLSKKLSKQQLAAATAIMAGKSIKQISKELEISESAVKNTTTAVYKKFGVGSRAQFLLLRG